MSHFNSFQPWVTLTVSDLAVHPAGPCVPGKGSELSPTPGQGQCSPESLSPALLPSPGNSLLHWLPRSYSCNQPINQPVSHCHQSMSKSLPSSMAVACMPTRYLSTSSMPFFLSFTSLYYLDPYTTCSIGHFKLMSEGIQVTQAQCGCQEFRAKSTQSTIQKLMLGSKSWDSHILIYATENPELGTFWTGKQNKLQNKSRNFFFSFSYFHVHKTRPNHKQVKRPDYYTQAHALCWRRSKRQVLQSTQAAPMPLPYPGILTPNSRKGLS